MVTTIGGANTLAFYSVFNQGFSLTKGTTHEFVVYTTSTLQTTPTPQSSTTPTPTSLTQAQVDQIGADFENSFTSDVRHFGSPNYTAAAAGNQGAGFGTCIATGASDGGTSAGFILPADNKIAVEVLNPASLGGGTGGYFTGTNYYPQSVANCIHGNGSVHSNGTPIFYVGFFGTSYGGGYTDASALSEDIPRGTAHEFQHLLNFVHHEVMDR